MNRNTLTIAGTDIDVEAGADFLVDKYPPLTLQHYDTGGESPRNRIVMEDLGRATLFGAFRGWKAAASTMHAAEAASWPQPSANWRLNAEPSLSTVDWLGTDEVQEAWALFSDIARGPSGGWRETTASKLLHLKWPNFFPVLDGSVRTIYKDLGMEKEQQIPGSRKRVHPSTRGLWLAVRHDLIDSENVSALATLRAEIESRQPHDPEKVGQLLELGDLRILDSLAWAVGSGELPT